MSDYERNAIAYCSGPTVVAKSTEPTNELENSGKPSEEQLMKVFHTLSETVSIENFH